MNEFCEKHCECCDEERMITSTFDYMVNSLVLGAKKIKY